MTYLSSDSGRRRLQFPFMGQEVDVRLVQLCTLAALPLGFSAYPGDPGLGNLHVVKGVRHRSLGLRRSPRP